MHHSPVVAARCAADLFDVETWTSPARKGDKPRQATRDECKRYLMDVAERAGLSILAEAELYAGWNGRNDEVRGLTFGKLLHKGGWELVEVPCFETFTMRREQVERAPVYEDGAYTVPMPGAHQHQARVTLEQLDEAGEVVSSSTLPRDKKDCVIWDAKAVRKVVGPVAKPVKAKARRKPAAEPVQPETAVSGPAVADTSPAPGPVEDAPAIEAAGDVGLADLVAMLADRVAALEALVGQPLPIISISRERRLRIARRYLAIRRERASLRANYRLGMHQFESLKVEHAASVAERAQLAEAAADALASLGRKAAEADQHRKARDAFKAELDRVEEDNARLRAQLAEQSAEIELARPLRTEVARLNRVVQALERRATVAGLPNMPGVKLAVAAVNGVWVKQAANG